MNLLRMPSFRLGGRRALPLGAPFGLGLAAALAGRGAFDLLVNSAGLAHHTPAAEKAGEGLGAVAAPITGTALMVDGWAAE